MRDALEMIILLLVLWLTLPVFLEVLLDNDDEDNWP